MRLLRYFAILIVLIVILDRSLGLVMDSFYEKMIVGQSGGKINDFESKNKVSIVSIGNSRSAHNIVPQLMGDKSYNLSHNGMSLAFHTGVISEILSKQKPSIDTILLHIEPFESYNNDLQSERDIRHLGHYYGINDFITERINSISFSERFKYCFSLFRYNGKLMSTVKNAMVAHSIKDTKQGYVPLTYDPFHQPEKKLNVQDSIFLSKKSIQLSTDLKTNIGYIKQLCDEKNIALICFTAPEFYTNPIQFIKLEHYLNSENIPYFNFKAAPLTEMGLDNTKYWRDSAHLNHNGAEVFTKYFKQKLKTQ